MREGGFDVCFIQETNKSAVNNGLVARLWGGDDFEWFAQPSNDLSGSILSIWRKGMLNFLIPFSTPGFVGVAVQQEPRTIYFVNIYSGCSIIGGDFNTVTSRSERKKCLF